MGLEEGKTQFYCLEGIQNNYDFETNLEIAKSVQNYTIQKNILIQKYNIITPPFYWPPSLILLYLLIIPFY